MKLPSIVLTSVASVALTVLMLAAPHARPVDTARTRLFKYQMGTSVRVEAYGGTPEQRQEAADDAFAAIAGIDRVASTYREDSELSRVNRTAAGGPVEVSAAVQAVLEACDRVARQSDGAFDETLGPLAGAWGLTTHEPRVPSGAELAAVRPFIGWRLISIDPRAHTVAFARNGVRLDVDPVVSGFAAELAARGLRRRGLAGAVEVGGSQFLVGRPIGKSAWSIGIADPSRPERLLGAVAVSDGAVSATASASSPLPGLQRGPMPVLDPRTLQPSRASLSVTVLSADATVGAALSRAVFVLGPERGLSLLDQFPGTWAVVAHAGPDGTTRISVSPDHRAAYRAAKP